MKNRLDARVKRGAVVKALAIGSKRKHLLEPLTKFLTLTLDQIFLAQNPDHALPQNLSKSQAVIEDSFA
jgi:hypothetical protein